MDLAEKIVAARKASGLTIEQITEAAGLRSKNTYMGRESNPDQFRICELLGMYNAMNDIAKSILLEAIRDIFLP